VTPERFERVIEIYHGAAELNVASRADFLTKACGEDISLLEEVESLLSADASAKGFLRTSPTSLSHTEPESRTSVEVRIPAGRRIGCYHVDTFLGAGGMGQVYLATDSRLGRKVAIKLLPPGRAKDADARLQRFEAEAKAASALNHPNIVTVYDIGVADEGRFIVMEHVAGRTLREMLNGGPLLDMLPLLGNQMARALAAAHEGGIAHQDIKPENIMVRPDGLVKILDFGLARLTLSGDGIEAGGRFAGTVRYMSPEQVQGSSISLHSDVFSLGIVFYEMATGSHPFPADSILGSLHAIILGKPPGPRTLNASIGASLEQLIFSMLDKDPGKRPTATEISAALEVQPNASLLAGAVHNFPAERTRFIGREAELAALEPLLRDRSLRIVTLTGPGGTGKTRLAIRAAEMVRASYPGGVYFTDLSALSEANQLLPAIAKPLGVREAPGHDLSAALCSHLSSPNATLIVLDNFEHILDSWPRVGLLLERCNSLKVLVTSRLALRLYGEQEFPVAPLPLPDEGLEQEPERLGRFASIALFVQRAAAVRPGFELTLANAGDVAQVCRRLDGLPLAIELAASLVKVLPPASLLARMENRLNLLVGGGRDRPERQQTLRGTIDWSYELLLPSERTLFARLSVFFGGCTLEAAEAVCNTREDLGIDVIEGIASLVDKSLLVQSTVEGEEPRFFLLETIREYAREKLESTGESPSTGRAHAAYFLVYAEDIGAMEPDCKQRLAPTYEREYANIMAAIRFMIGAGEAEWALRLAGTQLWFWEYLEQYSEGREVMESVLRMPGAGAPTLMRARLAYSASSLCTRLGDWASALRLQEGEAMSIYRHFGDRQGIATVHNGLGYIKRMLGQSTESRAHFEEAVQIWRSLGNDEAADYTLNNIARLAEKQLDHATAEAILEPLVDRFRARGNLRDAASALGSLGDCAAAQGQFARARDYYEQSLHSFTVLDDATGCARVLTDLGNLARETGHFDEAGKHYRESLRKASVGGRRTHIVRALAEMAVCALRQSATPRALTLAASASTILQMISSDVANEHRKMIQEVFDGCRAALFPAVYADLLARSRRMTVQQSIEYALKAD